MVKSASSKQPLCWPCTNPSTTATTHTFFSHPALAHLQMHTLCFAEVHIWNETQQNLCRIMQAWIQVKRSRSSRTWQALRIVRAWYSLKAAEWADIAWRRADIAWRRAILSRVWRLWRLPDVVADLSEEDEGLLWIPDLVDSDSEADRLEEIVDSSTDDSSTDDLVLDEIIALYHVQFALHGLGERQ